MKQSLRMLVMCQLSDAQQMMDFDRERANYLINAAKVLLREFEDKEVDFDEMEAKVVEKLRRLKSA